MPGFKYYCRCGRRDSEKEQPLWDTPNTNRKNCKFCRLKRCQELAGMMGKWVISAGKPPVGGKGVRQIKLRKNNTNSHKEANNKTETSVRSNKYDLASFQETIDEMKLRYSNSFLRNNNKVIINCNLLQHIIGSNLNIKRVTHCALGYF